LGRLPNAGELKDTSEKMSAARALPAGVIALMKSLPKDALPDDGNANGRVRMCDVRSGSRGYVARSELAQGYSIERAVRNGRHCLQQHSQW
jgi:hypothetical protein